MFSCAASFTVVQIPFYTQVRSAVCCALCSGLCGITVSRHALFRKAVGSSPPWFFTTGQSLAFCTGAILSRAGILVHDSPPHVCPLCPCFTGVWLMWPQWQNPGTTSPLIIYIHFVLNIWKFVWFLSLLLKFRAARALEPHPAPFTQPFWDSGNCGVLCSLRSSRANAASLLFKTYLIFTAQKGSHICLPNPGWSFLYWVGLSYF
jgi:hypothetical protein